MRVGIIGFGFSGLMVTANLLRSTDKPLTIYIIDEKATGQGVAYSTTNPNHLLNVRASNMDAFANNHGAFVMWLKTVGYDVQQKMGIEGHYGRNDYVPRALYGAFLESIWQVAQRRAAEKNCSIKLVPSRAVALQAGEVPAILTERGDAIAVDKLVLAAGHETKPVLPHIKSEALVQNIWCGEALAGAANWPSPVLLMGTGLTAIDMVLSLRIAGYTGEIIAISHRGLMPREHVVVEDAIQFPPKLNPAVERIFHFKDDEIAAVKTLRQLVRFVREKIKQTEDWRAVIDGLRPHTQLLWQRLSARDQQKFLTHVSPFWNVHRHRMAPEIASYIGTEIAAQKLRVLRSKDIAINCQDEKISITADGITQPVHRILNCAGLELNLARSANPLLRQLLASGMVEPHATGLGIVADPHYRAWGSLHPHLYVIGSLLTGQLLESTAVPELRTQAAAIATDLLQAMRP